MDSIRRSFLLPYVDLKKGGNLLRRRGFQLSVVTEFGDIMLLNQAHVGSSAFSMEKCSDRI